MGVELIYLITLFHFKYFRDGAFRMKVCLYMGYPFGRSPLWAASHTGAAHRAHGRSDCTERSRWSQGLTNISGSRDAQKKTIHKLSSQALSQNQISCKMLYLFFWVVTYVHQIFFFILKNLFACVYVTIDLFIYALHPTL